MNNNFFVYAVVGLSLFNAVPYNRLKVDDDYCKRYDYVQTTQETVAPVTGTALSIS